MIDRACAGIADSAEAFAVSFRISGRLGRTQPRLARFLVGTSLDVLDAPVGLAPRARRDIKVGQATGRFAAPDAEIALAAVAGGLLGLLRRLERHPEDDEAVVDQLAEAMLRMLCIPTAEAARLVALPLAGFGTGQSRLGRCPVAPGPLAAPRQAQGGGRLPRLAVSAPG